MKVRLKHCSFTLLWLIEVVVSLSSCRDDFVYIQPEQEQHGETINSDIVGFYLLNEGNMGSNKASLDYYDFSTATYMRNIYQAANPTMPQSLGDVGNDIRIYGSRLYATINCSNFIEVMRAADATHIGSIQVPNCRYMRFQGAYGYVSSYAGPVLVSQDYRQLGYIAKFDTATLQIIDTCLVGFQPDEIEIIGNYLYVANSGGYLVPNYEHTLSVIDLSSFSIVDTIVVAPNLHHLVGDAYQQLWVTSRGDYYDDQAQLYCVDTRTRQVTDTLPLAVSGMWLDGDSLYVYGAQWSFLTMSNTLTYAIIDVRTHQLITSSFISDPAVTISVPYGMMVHPITKDIYITDAKTYVNPGTLWCIAPDGKAKWSVRTGDVPAHMCFVYNK